MHFTAIFVLELFISKFTGEVISGSVLDERGNTAQWKADSTNMYFTSKDSTLNDDERDLHKEQVRQPAEFDDPWDYDEKGVQPRRVKKHLQLFLSPARSRLARQVRNSYRVPKFALRQSPENVSGTPMSKLERSRYAYQVPTPVMNQRQENNRSLASTCATATGINRGTYSYNFSYVSTRNCFCDKFCEVFGDCCHDASKYWSTKYHGPSINLPANAHECLTANILDSNRLYAGDSAFGHGISVITKCPTAITDGRATLCKRVNRSDIVTSLLVTGETGLTYRNVHCAKCHGEIRVTFWKVVTQCDLPVNQSSVPEFQTVEDIIRENKCDRLLQFSAPAQIGFRTCKKLEAQCNATSDGKILTDKCKRGHASFVYMVNEPGTVYRNKYCAKCANLSDMVLTAKEPEKNAQDGETVFKKFSVIITLESEVQRCKPNHNEPGIENANSLTHVVNLYPRNCHKHSGPCDNKVPKRTEKPMELSSECESSTNNSNTTSMPAEDVVEVWLTVVLLSISLAAMVINFLIYLILPTLRNNPGKFLLSLISALFLAEFVFLVGASRTENYFICVGISVAIHYFFLASFFWMNVMAIDIFLTFGFSKMIKTPANKIRYFVLYSVYAWISPLVIVAAALVVNVVSDKSYYLNPNYGIERDSCWINRDLPLIVFFLLPLGTLMIANIVLFILTSLSICKITKSTERMIHKNEKSRLCVYLKLSTVVGLTWTFSIIAAFTNSVVFRYLFTIFNGLQGLFICLSFTMTKRVGRLLKEKFSSVRQAPATEEIECKSSSTSK